MRYPVQLVRDDNDTWMVDVPDFPEAHTFGDDKDEALVRAADALATAIVGYIKDRRPIPEPSEGEALFVNLPALTAAR